MEHNTSLNMNALTARFNRLSGRSNANRNLAAQCYRLTNPLQDEVNRLRRELQAKDDIINDLREQINPPLYNANNAPPAYQSGGRRTRKHKKSKKSKKSRKH